MNQNLRVRQMEAGDLLRAAALEQSSFSQPWSEKLLAEGLNSPLFFTIGKFDFRPVKMKSRATAFCVSWQMRENCRGLRCFQNTAGRESAGN